MSVALKFKKLDKRFKGSNHFTYYLEIYLLRSWGANATDNLELVKKFNEIRNWCIKNWETSTELDDYMMLNLELFSFNEYWSWSVEKYARRIYFKTDKEKMWAELTWM